MTGPSTSSRRTVQLANVDYINVSFITFSSLILFTVIKFLYLLIGMKVGVFDVNQLLFMENLS